MKVTGLLSFWPRMVFDSNPVSRRLYIFWLFQSALWGLILSLIYSIPTLMYPVPVIVFVTLMVSVCGGFLVLSWFWVSLRRVRDVGIGERFFVLTGLFCFGMVFLQEFYGIDLPFASSYRSLMRGFGDGMDWFVLGVPGLLLMGSVMVLFLPSMRHDVVVDENSDHPH